MLLQTKLVIQDISLSLSFKIPKLYISFDQGAKTQFSVLLQKTCQL